MQMCDLVELRSPSPNRRALEYSAEGLEPVSVEGALARTQGRLL